MKSLHYKKVTTYSIIFLLLYLFYPKSAHAQSLYIENELKPYYQMYVQESKQRGIDIEPYLEERLDSLYLDCELKFPALGICFLTNNVVIISGDYMNHKDVLKTAVFHELNHILQRDTEYACSKCFNLTFEEEKKHAIPYSYKHYLAKDFGMSNLDSLFTRVSRDLKNQLGEE